jgi:hypothetical protein
MLPTSPSGLPSGPRSRSVGPSRRNARPSEPQSSKPSFPGEQQRVRPSFPRERSRSSAPDSNRGGWQRKHGPQSSPDSGVLASRTSQDSDSTASSISSLFERVRNGAAGYASSLTSIEDSGIDADEERRGRSLRKQRVISPEPLPQEIQRTDTGTGDGYTIWSKVTTAASSLTISVSKAWASNITMYPGEETPIGEESRLTKAMKAYHISQCNNREELPDWLFSESERIPRRTARHSPGEAAEPVESRRFGSSNSVPRHQSNRQEISEQPSEPVDRLRRIREAKRAAVVQAEQPRITSLPTERGKRIGLPTGPAQRRRG